MGEKIGKKNLTQTQHTKKNKSVEENYPSNEEEEEDDENDIKIDMDGIIFAWNNTKLKFLKPISNKKFATNEKLEIDGIS
ncbi:hypothetical protein QR98_0025750 [Sarcoptes scabiei]|uniref:Uncharacterized protein n=1 Tax=Sarcoptes scabiei TaxID=52283 RepID=A0A132A0S3_SARSC|nr:hypothetical protein QR98_0025750 [Sarcoptes scabiei]